VPPIGRSFSRVSRRLDPGIHLICINVAKEARANIAATRIVEAQMLRLVVILSCAILLLGGRGYAHVDEAVRPQSVIQSAAFIERATPPTAVPADQAKCPAPGEHCASGHSSGQPAGVADSGVAIHPIGRGVRVSILEEFPGRSVLLKRDPPVPRQVG
jgi:hypothetical protein